jgi:hypothetical protein
VAAFHISPGVFSSELNSTGIVPAVATTTGAFAGIFKWGPVGKRILLTNEKDLGKTYGFPTNLNAETWFTAANFLAYSKGLYVARAANTTGSNTDVANSTLSAVGLNTGSTSNNMLLNSTVKNSDDFLTKNFVSPVSFVARYPGDQGNALRTSVCDSAAAYTSTINLQSNSDFAANSLITYAVGSNTATIKVQTSVSGTNTEITALANTISTGITVGDYVKAGNNTVGIQYLKVSAIGAPTISGNTASVILSFSQNFNLSGSVTSNTVTRFWEFYQSVRKAPAPSLYQAATANPSTVDQIHVVVVDNRGDFTGVPGTVVESYDSLSRATDAKDQTGSTLFWKNVINAKSAYVWAASDLTTAASNTAALLANSSGTTATSIQFTGGQDGLDENTVAISNITAGYDLFTNPEDVDVSIVMQGVARGGTTLANYIIGNIVLARKDCVFCVSSAKSDTVNAAGFESDNLVAFRNGLTATSYAIMDSGYKYIYDKYNDVYRWVPLNGDVAGVIARNDLLGDPWTSPGGFNRGTVLNTVKLAFNPASVAIRDTLYQNGINPVVSFKGRGVILYGDKTLIGTPSAFDRINVRRLFIVLEKSISIAASALLFEINDAFTQAQFLNMVEPYLREIQGRRGITNFQVICDSTNNGTDITSQNGFVGDIYVQPAYSINTISLSFNAVRGNVTFKESSGIPIA